MFRRDWESTSELNGGKTCRVVENSFKAPAQITLNS